jgi:putative ABC transport system permease protein
MSVLWYKVWFDLWRNKGRTLLAVCSIAAGVFAVGGIFGLLDQLLNSMDAAHRAVQPSHINIILRDYVDEAAIENLRETPGVLDIDPANQASVRYRLTSDGEWKLATLVERPDFANQAYDRLVLLEGQWPAGETLAIERLTGKNWDLEQGQEISFEIDGEARQFAVGGIVRHPFVQPPQFGGQAHFFADAGGLAQFGVPEGRYGQLLVQIDDYSLQRAQDIAGELRARLGDAGYGVAVTLYQDPERHWGRRFLEGVNLVLQIMALVSLFMSVILVLNTFTALITQQTDQIGVIKAVGGQSGVVVRIYLVSALILGALALIVAVPSGAIFAYFMARWYLGLFNIDYETFAVSVRALTLQGSAALAAPLLAALWPVLKGARISVREAIASYGVGADFGSGALDRTIERIGARLLPPAYAAALGNMFRRKGRLGLTLLVLSVAGAMFLIVMSLIASIQLTLDNDMARRGYDIRIGFMRDQDAARAVEIAEGEAGVVSAEVWTSRNATLLREGERLQDSAGLGAQLQGVPEGGAAYRPLVVKGRWLEPGDDRAVVISAETAEKNRIAVGDTITLDLGPAGAEQWQVVGAYRVVYDTGFVIESIYAPREAVLAAAGLGDVATLVHVTAADPRLGVVQATADAIKTRYEAAGFKIDLYTTAIKLEERQYALNQFNTVISMLLGLASLVASVGAIGLAGALGISVVERTREIGVMRAIGARSRTLMGVFVMEGALQGLLSWVVALPVAFVVARPLARLLGQTMLDINLDFSFHWPAVALWLGLSILIAACAAIFPARTAARVSVRQALSYS